MKLASWTEAKIVAQALQKFLANACRQCGFPLRKKDVRCFQCRVLCSVVEQAHMPLYQLCEKSSDRLKMEPSHSSDISVNGSESQGAMSEIETNI